VKRFSVLFLLLRRSHRQMATAPPQKPKLLLRLADGGVKRAQVFRRGDPLEGRAMLLPRWCLHLLHVALPSGSLCLFDVCAMLVQVPSDLPSSSWEDFLVMAAEKLSLQHSQAAPVGVFDSDGHRLERLEDISHDQVLFVAHAGEAFAKALPLAVEKKSNTNAAGAAEDVRRAG
jgi:hypothetical protein